MVKIKFKQFLQKKSLLFGSLVLFSLFISENACSTYWKRDFAQVGRYRGNCILFKIRIYDYSFGPNKHRFLQYCKIEVSADGENYYDKLVEIHTKRQNMSNNTTMNLKKKLDGAILTFRDNIVSHFPGASWHNNLRSNLKVIVSNFVEIAVVTFDWRLDIYSKDVRFIQISGIWQVEDQNEEHFDNVVYEIYRPNLSVLKSNIPDINVKISKTDTVKVFKDSQAIVIKGVDPGANIKVYNTSGAEIKSVISNNEVVKIKLPVKQIYIVHIGNSRYKVAL